ncbi:MAG TPA: hypothetical protein VI318_04385 [Baekduia sp.]
MKRPKFLAVLVVLAVAVVAVVVATAGGASNHSNSSASASASAKGSASAIKTRHTPLGTILVDGKGRTLYLFQKDKTTKSTCSGACAMNWPPATTSGKPTAGSGVTAGWLGTSRRSDGSTQITFAGHPLYRFAGDDQPGATNGQAINAFGAKWYVVSTGGRAVTKVPQSPAPAPAQAPAAPAPSGY